MFAMSVTGAIGNVECGTYLTENVADDMIGKISGVSYTMTIGACALGRFSAVLWFRSPASRTRSLSY